MNLSKHFMLGAVKVIAEKIYEKKISS